MENQSTSIERKRLPDKAGDNFIWKDSYQHTEITCFDDNTREARGVRILPPALNQIQKDIPKQKLARPSSRDNVGPFIGSNDFGVVLFIEFFSDYFEDQCWSRNPISEFLPVEIAREIQDDALLGLCLVESNEDYCLYKKEIDSDKVHVYDLNEMETIEEIDLSDISIYDVPDSVILDCISSDHISDLISQEL